jgi:hypothetical protein
MPVIDVLVGPEEAEVRVIVKSSSLIPSVIAEAEVVSLPARPTVAASADSSRATSAGDGFCDSDESRRPSRPAASPGLIAEANSRERANVRNRAIDVFL